MTDTKAILSTQLMVDYMIDHPVDEFSSEKEAAYSLYRELADHNAAWSRDELRHYIDFCDCSSDVSLPGALAYSELPTGPYRVIQACSGLYDRGRDEIFESHCGIPRATVTTWLHNTADPRMRSLVQLYDHGRQGGVSDAWVEICKRRKDILLEIVVNEDIGSGVDFLLDKGIYTIEELEQPIMEQRSTSCSACRFRYLDRRRERTDLPVLTENTYLPPVDRVSKEYKDCKAWAHDKFSKEADSRRVSHCKSMSVRYAFDMGLPDLASMSDDEREKLVSDRYDKLASDINSGALSPRDDIDARVLVVRRFYLDAEETLADAYRNGDPNETWVASWFNSLPEDSPIKLSVSKISGYGKSDALRDYDWERLHADHYRTFGERSSVDVHSFSQRSPSDVTIDDFYTTLKLFNRSWGWKDDSVDDLLYYADMHTFGYVTVLDSVMKEDGSHGSLRSPFSDSEVAAYLCSGEQYIGLPVETQWEREYTKLCLDRVSGPCPPKAEITPQNIVKGCQILYDYRDKGRDETIDALNAAGIQWDFSDDKAFEKQHLELFDHSGDAFYNGNLIVGLRCVVNARNGSYGLVREKFIPDKGPWSWLEAAKKQVFGSEETVKPSQEASKLSDITWTIRLSKKGEPYVNGQMNIDGEVRDVHFKKTFGAHEFDDNEICRLLGGDKISIPSRSGEPLTVKLGPTKYMGREGFGIVIDDSPKQSAGRRGLPSIGCQDDNQLGAGDDEDTPDN